MNFHHEGYPYSSEYNVIPCVDFSPFFKNNVKLLVYFCSNVEHKKRTITYLFLNTTREWHMVMKKFQGNEYLRKVYNMGTAFYEIAVEKKTWQSLQQ